MEKILEQLKDVRDILQKIWLTLVLVSFLGVPSVILFSGILEGDITMPIVLTGIIEGLLILVRVFILRRRYQISKDNIIAITLAGTLITTVATILLVTLLIIIGILFFGFSYN